MERRYFLLEAGYLNIDDKGLYLSPSGNWQEALATPERTAIGRTKRSVYGLFGLVLIMTRGALEFAHVSTNRANGLVLSIGVAGAGVMLLLHRLRHLVLTLVVLLLMKRRHLLLLPLLRPWKRGSVHN